MSKQFQRTHSVLFLRCIELWTKAFFLVTWLFKGILLKSDRLNKSNVEYGKPVKTRASQGTNPVGIRKKRIIKSLGYSKNIRICICNSYETVINLLSTGINKRWRYCRHFEFGNVTWSRVDQSDIFRRWRCSVAQSWSFLSPEPLGLICNRPVALLVSLPRDQETTGSGDENGACKMDDVEFEFVYQFNNHFNPYRPFLSLHVAKWKTLSFSVYSSVYRTRKRGRPFSNDVSYLQTQFEKLCLLFGVGFL